MQIILRINADQKRVINSAKIKKDEKYNNVNADSEIAEA